MLVTLPRAARGGGRPVACPVIFSARLAKSLEVGCHLLRGQLDRVPWPPCPDDLLESGDEVVEVPAQLADLVLGLHVNPPRQIALGDVLEHVHGVSKRLDHASGHDEGNGAEDAPRAARPGSST